MRHPQARRTLAATFAALLSGTAAHACSDDPQPLRGSAISVSDPQANVGSKLVTTLRDRFPTAPSSAFVDLAVTTLGAALHDDYDRARTVVGGLVRRGVACLEEGRHDCREEAVGATFDFSTGRHAISLMPVDGYSSEPRPLATEGPDGIAVRDSDAFGFVMDEERSTLRSTQVYGDTPPASATAP